MTIPLIILLSALGLFILFGLGLVVIGVWINDDNTPVVVFAGLVVAALATCGLAGVAYHDDAQTCRLSPSSLVEAAP